jgi:hypothetical protein
MSPHSPSKNTVLSFTLSLALCFGGIHSLYSAPSDKAKASLFLDVIELVDASQVPDAELPVGTPSRKFECRVISQTPETVEIEVARSKGVVEPIKLPAKLVKSIQKGNYEANAFFVETLQPILELGDFSQPNQFYADRIAQFEGFITKFGETSVTATVREALAKHQAEFEEVKKGRIRIKNDWYESEDAEYAQLDRRALQVIEDILREGSNASTKAFRDRVIEAGRLKNSRYYPDILKTVADVLSGRVTDKKDENTIKSDVRENKRTTEQIKRELKEMLSGLKVRGDDLPPGDKVNFQYVEGRWYPKEARKGSSAFPTEFRPYAPRLEDYYLPIDADTRERADMLLNQIKGIASDSKALEKSQQDLARKQQQQSSESQRILSDIEKLNPDQYQPVLDQIQSVRAAFDANPADAKRLVDMIEAVRPQWRECNIFPLTYRLMARKLLSETTAMMQQPEPPFQAALSQLEALDPIIQGAGGKWATLQAQSINALRKQAEAARYAKVRKETIERVESLIAEGKHADAFNALEQLYKNPPSLPSDMKNAVWANASNIAYGLFTQFKEARDSALAKRSLELSYAFWGNNPEFAKYIMKLREQIGGLVAEKKYQEAAKEISFAQQVLGNQGTFGEILRELSTQAIDQANSDLFSFSFGKAFEGSDFAKSLWEDNPGISKFHYIFWGGVIVGLLILFFIVFKLVDVLFRKHGSGSVSYTPQEPNGE